MADQQTFTGITPEIFMAIQQKAVQESDLTISGNHGVTGKQGFQIGWDYDPVAQILTLTLIKHPFLIPAGMAMGRMQQLVNSCRPVTARPLFDHRNVKLGRSGVSHSPKRKLYGVTLMNLLPPAPAACDNRKGVTNWGMMRNDSLGDCTCAGIGHSLQVSTLDTGAEVTAPDGAVLGAYEKYCGYVNGDASTDNGGDELVVLAGIAADGFDGHKLLGHVSVDPKNWDHVAKAIAHFGSIYIGAELPLSCQSQQVWDADSTSAGQPGTWGGHCMVAAAYNAPAKRLPWITWGINQDATIGWAQKYVDEVHVLLWDAWVTKFPGETQQQILALLNELNDGD